MSEFPPELFESRRRISDEEMAARLGRYIVLQEMGFFDEPINIKLAMNYGAGSWVGKVRRQFSNKFGDVVGCHPADLEVAAEMRGVFDDIYDIEALSDGKTA